MQTTIASKRIDNTEVCMSRKSYTLPHFSMWQLHLIPLRVTTGSEVISYFRHGGPAVQALIMILYDPPRFML